jgi:predicted RNase H-like HicB family nuclease
VSDYHINILWSDEDEGELAKEAWLEAARAEGKPIPAASYRPQRHEAS